MTALSRAAQLCLIFLYILLFCVTLIYGGKAAFLMAGSLIAIPFSVIQPSSFFIFFMTARPMADLFSKTSVLGMNPASWVTVLFIAFCIKEFLVNRDRPAGHRDTLLPAFNKYFAVLLFLYIPSFLQTGDAQTSVLDLMRMLSVGLAINYVLGWFYRDENSIRLFCAMALLSAAGPLLLGFYQWAFGAGRSIEGFNRIFGAFTHPNVFAEYLLYLFFIALYWFRFAVKGRPGKVAILLLMGVLLFELYHTYTRTIWIAFAACLLLYTLMQKKALVKHLSFLAVSGLFLAALPLLQSRFSDITQATDTGRRSSLDWRLRLWAQTVGEIKEHPFFGSGLGMYERNVGVMAHNDFLRMAYETGLIATAVYVLGFLGLAFYALHQLRQSGLEPAREARLQTGVCLIAGFLISSLADNMLRSTVILFYYMTTILLFLSGHRAKARP